LPAISPVRATRQNRRFEPNFAPLSATLARETMHHGRAGEVIQQRRQVLSQAYRRNPEPFVRTHPKRPGKPSAVWINKPAVTPATEGDLH